MQNYCVRGAKVFDNSKEIKKNCNGAMGWLYILFTKQIQCLTVTLGVVILLPPLEGGGHTDKQTKGRIEQPLD